MNNRIFALTVYIFLFAVISITTTASINLNKSPIATSISSGGQDNTKKNTDRFNLKIQRGSQFISTMASATKSAATGIPSSLKLIFGAGGIYAAFLYYGNLQEDVFHYKSEDGSKFQAAWFLQALEALANVIVGGVGLQIAGGTRNLPQDMFALSGATQVCAKAFTSLALAAGVSFPVVTLAKSGKMVPVMLGSLLLGGAKYSLREYASVLAIIVGTTIVSMGKGKSGDSSSALGLVFIGLSLACDGITGGVQKRLKAKSEAAGVKAKPYDFMFWTNLYMALTAAVIALYFGEFNSGIQFCLKNPIILNKILKFAICSAIGQSFIFYTISTFDPLVCSTVTTTRKVFSVLLSIFLKGHAMSTQGWFGISLASLGILAELQDKSSGHGKEKKGDAKAAVDKKI